MTKLTNRLTSGLAFACIGCASALAPFSYLAAHFPYLALFLLAAAILITSAVLLLACLLASPFAFAKASARHAVFCIAAAGLAAILIAFNPTLMFAIDYARLSLLQSSWDEIIATRRSADQNTRTPLTFKWGNDPNTFRYLIYDDSDRVLNQGELSAWAKANIEVIRYADQNDCASDARHVKGSYYLLVISCWGFP